MKQVKFVQMKDGDKEDYEFLMKHEVEHTKGTADRLIKALVELDEGLSGYKNITTRTLTAVSNKSLA